MSTWDFSRAGGTVSHYVPADGGYALQSTIQSGTFDARGLAIGPNNEVYVSDGTVEQVRRIVLDDRIFLGVFESAPATEWTTSTVVDYHGALPQYTIAPSYVNVDPYDGMYVTISYYNQNNFYPSTVNTPYASAPSSPAPLYPYSGRSVLDEGQSVGPNKVGKSVPDSLGNVYIQVDGSVFIFRPDGSNSLLLTYAGDFTVDRFNKLWFVDGDNFIHEYDPDPDVNLEWSVIDPSGAALYPDSYASITTDPHGNFYMFDFNNSVIAKYSPDGAGGFTRPANVASVPNEYQVQLAADARGDVFVSLTDQNAVDFYAPDGAGGYTKQANSPFTGLNVPIGIGTDPLRDLVFVADAGNVRVVRASRMPPPPPF